jgi:hypothetical protein
MWIKIKDKYYNSTVVDVWYAYDEYGSKINGEVHSDAGMLYLVLNSKFEKLEQQPTFKKKVSWPRIFMCKDDSSMWIMVNETEGFYFDGNGFQKPLFSVSKLSNMNGVTEVENVDYVKKLFRT